MADLYSFTPERRSSGTIAPIPDLTQDQRKVLKALMAKDATPADRTGSGLRARTLLGRLSPILSELEAFDTPLVENAEDATLEMRFWWATPAAGDLLDREC